MHKGAYYFRGRLLQSEKSASAHVTVGYLQCLCCVILSHSEIVFQDSSIQTIKTPQWGLIFNSKSEKFLIIQGQG